MSSTLIESVAPELIGANEKFACLELRLAGAAAVMSPTRLRDGLAATGLAPFELPPRWSRRVGEPDTPAVQRPRLYLLATRRTESPDRDDLELRAVIRRVLRFYNALLIATPGIALTSVRLFAGSKKRVSTNVVTSTSYGRIYSAAGTPRGWGVSERALLDAADIAHGVRETHAIGEFDRLARVNNALRNALSAPELTVRLHQSVRALEGLVLPPSDKLGTGKIFAERVSFFTGKQRLDLVRDLYTMRGSIEHLHGPEAAVQAVRPDVAPDGAIEHLAFAAFVAENLTRMCLHRLYTRPKLWTHFQTDIALEAFWNAKRKRDLWGPDLAGQMTRVIKAFDSKAARRALKEAASERRVAERADAIDRGDLAVAPKPASPFGPRVES